MGEPSLTSEEKTSNPLKVLIADDDAPTRILLRAAISQWGYTVEEARDGEEAFEKIMAKEDAPRLLILDWLMPKIDGIQLCEKTKSMQGYHPYIILLTQVTGTSNIIKGLEAGADEFLSKPFNMAELRSRLSTGARIMRHELDLVERTQKLHDFFIKIEEEIREIHVQVNKLAPTCESTSEFSNLNEHLMQLENAIKQFKNTPMSSDNGQKNT